MMGDRKITGFVLAFVMFVGGLTGCLESDEADDFNEANSRLVVDMRGEDVWVPKNISRVIDISDGFITSVMYSLGIADRVVALGSTNLKEIDTYSFETVSGDNYSFSNGMNPVTYLSPRVLNLPAVAEYGVAVNYESVASLNPDVVIVRLGFCSLNTDEYGEEEDIQRTVDMLEALDIPLVVLYGPPAFNTPNISKISEEIRIIGSVFGLEDNASALADYLAGTVTLVLNRTRTVTEEEKPRVLLFGLSPNARESGGAGDVLSTDTIESYFIEEIVHAKNAVTSTGGWKIMSAEQILALNPDVIVLPTDWGYHPPRELYTATYYQNLQELDAIKNHRVWALPWTPYNCAKRLEYPIEIMIIAKAAYPDLFDDFKIHEWVLEFYQQVYHVDLQTAQELRSIQWLDWTVEDDA
jgi:iron complex transport system substrate-binding protein